MTEKSIITFKPKQITKRLLGVLHSRSQDVISGRFGLGNETKKLTLEAIGKKYKITRERVRQIENYSITNIRKSKEYAKEKSGSDLKFKEGVKFVAKDVFVNSAIETAHGLSVGIFSKEKLGAKRRTLNFIKEIGTIARGLGIYGLAISGAELPRHSLDKLINGIKEQGVVGAISHNFIQNAERLGHLAAHPTEVFRGHTNLAPKLQGHHEIPIAPEHPLEHHEAVLAPEHPPVIEHHEAPVATATVEHGDHTVAVEVLNDREGVLNGVNKIIHDHPGIFVHKNGQAWTAAEIHTWKVRELKEMGFKIEGDKWGNPMTMHAGAKVEVFTDEQGQPHFKLASDEHVTFNKNYKWTEGKHADNVLVEEPKNIPGHKPNPYVGSPAPAANANVVAEQPVVHAQVKVDADIKDIAVVHHAAEVNEAASKGGQTRGEKIAPVKSTAAVPEKVLVVPEIAAEKGTLSQVLLEQKYGHDKKEFLNTFQNMRAAMADRWENSLIRTEGAEKFLQAKIDYLYERQLHYDSPLDNAKLSTADTEQIKQLLRAEDLYKNGKSGWEESLDKAVFSKDDDRAMQLAFASHSNPSSHPILTNNSHAVRIWDPVKKKDVFWYEEKATFNLDKNGNLIIKAASGQQVIDKKEVLRMANE